jgi:hypothetical protein
MCVLDQVLACVDALAEHVNERCAVRWRLAAIHIHDARALIAPDPLGR